MCRWMTGWVVGWMGGWTDGWIWQWPGAVDDGWMWGLLDEWKKEWMERWLDILITWTYRWMERQRDRWMDRLSYTKMFCLITSIIKLMDVNLEHSPLPWRGHCNLHWYVFPCLLYARMASVSLTESVTACWTDCSAGSHVTHLGQSHHCLYSRNWHCSSFYALYVDFQWYLPLS